MFNFYFKRVWKIVEIMKEELDQRPSFFEFMTLLSLVIFREDRGEILVLTRLDHYLKVKGGKNKK